MQLCRGLRSVITENIRYSIEYVRESGLSHIIYRSKICTTVNFLRIIHEEVPSFGPEEEKPLLEFSLGKLLSRPG
jgi:hypothetical protein